jgi:hypothetical protein
MATNMLSQPETDWADARRTGPIQTDASSQTTPANYVSNATLDARLIAIGGIYTQAYVDSMTQNDKIYAIRVNDDPLSIKP